MIHLIYWSGGPICRSDSYYLSIKSYFILQHNNLKKNLVIWILLTLTPNCIFSFIVAGPRLPQAILSSRQSDRPHHRPSLHRRSGQSTRTTRATYSSRQSASHFSSPMDNVRSTPGQIARHSCSLSIGRGRRRQCYRCLAWSIVYRGKSKANRMFRVVALFGRHLSQSFATWIRRDCRSVCESDFVFDQWESGIVVVLYAGECADGENRFGGREIDGDFGEYCKW